MKFSAAVRLSFACILRQVKWWSVSMVRRYDIISSRWSRHFWVKMHVFPTIKVKFVDKMMQSNYLCVILQVKHKLILTVFTWFLILDKIQDRNHVWWHHRPPAAPPPIKYTSSCREILQHIKNSGGVLITKPPPPPRHSPCTTVGVGLCVYVWGLK